MSLYEGIAYHTDHVFCYLCIVSVLHGWRTYLQNLISTYPDKHIHLHTLSLSLILFGIPRCICLSFIHQIILHVKYHILLVKCLLFVSCYLGCLLDERRHPRLGSWFPTLTFPPWHVAWGPAMCQTSCSTRLLHAYNVFAFTAAHYLRNIVCRYVQGDSRWKVCVVFGKC